MRRHLIYFLAGFLSTLLFHQGAVAILHALEVIPNAAYNLKPTLPFGVPTVASLAFFGGLWGNVIGELVRKDRTLSFWLKCLIFGAIGPTLVAFLVVFPLKGIELKPAMIPFGLLLNGLWGLGLGIFIKLFSRGQNSNRAKAI